ncbi:MAG: protein kinase [Candidatus Obscuribacterales bacterium]|nr:protein kinase [Candidatus Obscuribacterales bacterium]
MEAKQKDANAVEIKGTPAPTRKCPACGELYDKGVSKCSIDGSLLCPISVTDALLGQTVDGKYTLLSVVGTGGYSTVYSATQESLQRTVAVKVLNHALSSQVDKVQRFDHEARIISRLSHHNLAAVIDYGLLDDGRPFIVMEYVDGRALSVHLFENGAMQWRVAVKMFLLAAEGIETVHKAKIVHRDIKPSNIIINRDASVVKVTDFGLAKSLEPDHSSLTATGETIGTPAYMSPEQCTGGTLDVRSDIYSFGCVMYETLTGKKVADGASALEILHKQLNQTPRSFAEQGCKTVPDDLEKIVRRCLAKDPELRFQTMSELGDALSSCLQGSSVKEFPPVERTGESRKSAFSKIAVICSACLLVIAGVVGIALLNPTRTDEASEPIARISTVAKFPPLPDSREPVVTDDVSELLRQFGVIQNRANLLSAEGKSAEADDMQSQLNSFKELYEGQFTNPSDRSTELQMVGVYGPTSGRWDSKNGPVVNVHVTYTGAPIVLALTAYESVIWKLSVDPGVRIKQVVTSGYYRQKVDGLPPGVPVWSSSYEERRDTPEANGRKPFFYAYSKSEGSFHKAVSALKVMLNLNLRTFQGQYSADGKTIIVGPSDKIWRAQQVLYRMRDLYAKANVKVNQTLDHMLNEFSFEGVYRTGMFDGGVAKFVGANPLKSTARPCGGVRAVARDKDGELFGITDHAFVKVDEKGGGKEVKTPIELPRISWACGLAFDSKRNCFVIASLGGEGFLHRYYPRTKNWDVSSLDNLDLCGLAYSPEDDCLYGIERGLALVRFDADGKPLERFPLKGSTLPPKDLHPMSGQLYCKDNFLIWMPFSHASGSTAEYAYLLDKRTGEVLRRMEIVPR